MAQPSKESLSKTNTSTSVKEDAVEKTPDEKVAKKTRVKKKKEKEQPVKEQPVLYKYTIAGNVKTSSGRFRFTDIIEAQDKDIAISIFKQRAKKEFSAVRTVNKIDASDFKDGDEKSIIEIKEDLPLAEKTDDSEPTLQDKINTMIDNIVEDSKDDICFKVVFTPNRKPRKRDYGKSFLLVNASTLEEAKKKTKDMIESMGMQYKEKWAVFIKGTMKDFEGSIRGRINNALKSGDIKKLLDSDDLDSDDSDLDDSFSDIDSPINFDEEDSLGKIIAGELKGFDVQFETKTKFISKITPNGFSLATLLRCKTYKVVLVRADGTELPAFEIPSPSEIHCIPLAFYAMKDYPNKNLYVGVRSFKIFLNDTLVEDSRIPKGFLLRMGI